MKITSILEGPMEIETVQTKDSSFRTLAYLGGSFYINDDCPLKDGTFSKIEVGMKIRGKGVALCAPYTDKSGK